MAIQNWKIRRQRAAMKNRPGSVVERNSRMLPNNVGAALGPDVCECGCDDLPPCTDGRPYNNLWNWIPPKDVPYIDDGCGFTEYWDGRACVPDDPFWWLPVDKNHPTDKSLIPPSNNGKKIKRINRR